MKMIKHVVIDSTQYMIMDDVHLGMTCLKLQDQSKLFGLWNFIAIFQPSKLLQGFFFFPPKTKPIWSSLHY